MKKLPAIRILRSRALTAWVSPFVSVGLILSFIFCCMCGPFCGSISAKIDQPESSCCAAHAAQPSSCCSTEPGESCCDEDVAEYVLLDSIPDIQLAVPAVVLFIADRFETEPDAVHCLLSEISFTEHSPPPYLRFQSFLI
ncbi:hypothetical protein P4C99_09360 [Pontiellaceae bacterium B1224]|nr:hypothetical protein [Pontiellaceae bacterium B1224]